MSSTDEPRILTINSGSSSLKFALIAREAGIERRLVEGAALRVGQPDGVLALRVADRVATESAAEFPDHGAAVDAMFAALERGGIAKPDAVGHRLVHGGPHHLAPTLVDADLIASLRAVVAFAPLHLPAELAGIDAVAKRYPALAQVVSFDTAFHAELPELGRRFALPEWSYAQGIRRYGFHGLSYTYIVSRLGPQLRPRTIVAHLGNGSSMVALLNGQPIDTTMGLTPCGGIMMGTRSGDLDPGVVTFLLRQGHGAGDVERLVNHESGLLGVSGGRSDMQALLARREADSRAHLAVSMFCYQARKAIGGLSAALGGLDLLVFTGGIGAHASIVRASICQGLAHLGVELDEQRNDAGDEVISAPAARCVVRALTTDEEVVIARNARHVLALTPAPSG